METRGLVFLGWQTLEHVHERRKGEEQDTRGSYEVRSPRAGRGWSGEHAEVPRGSY